MKKFFRRTLTALLIVTCVVTASFVGATVKMYTATGEGYAWEDESQEIAKLRARDKAIKNATKQAGVYLKTYSRSVNNELTDDEVTAITSNSWQLVGEPKYTRKIINHSGDTQIIVWTATVEVNVDDAELQSWLKRDDKDKSTIITQTREAQKSSAENERTVEDLRERYNRATSQAERDKIRQQMNDADRDFLANQKNEDGLKLYYAKDYQGAIRLYSEAIELNPKFAGAYYNRGTAYAALKQHEQAIQDFDKAIQLNPNYAEAYNNRGVAYRHLKQHERAIQDFDKAIQLDPNDAAAYSNRGAAYGELKQYERAIQDYDKAIQLHPNYAD
ncbi:MAG: tetratricopeptide repeat protein, partial [Selenomonadaceae bacterium]|nr:tetratricopeptide repeat protein [Selenomonadaceae bacterium]